MKREICTLQALHHSLHFSPPGCVTLSGLFLPHIENILGLLHIHYWYYVRWILMLKLKFNTLATCCEEPTLWKKPWCWERLRAGGEGDDRRWDGWMALPTQQTWVWVNSGSWWWTGRPGVLRFMGSQRIEHKWVNELNWTESSSRFLITKCNINVFEFLYTKTKNEKLTRASKKSLLNWWPWNCSGQTACFWD